MTRTRSEDLFEWFCAEREILYEMVDTGREKTHDYDIEWNDQRIAVEVKQLERDDVPSKDGEVRFHRTTPGDHIRRKINKAGTQIRSRISDGDPSLLVIYNDIYRQINVYSEPYDFLVAMYGLQNVILDLPKNGSIEIRGSQFEGRRKMTEGMNTSFSALARLREGENDTLNLDIYHNRHAAVPLDTSEIRADGVKHFIVPGDMEQFTQWEEIE